MSGFFGTALTDVHPAPQGHEAIFFSNDAASRQLVEDRGWEFRLVGSQPQTEDSRVSSLQSKYVKYLQHFDEFPDLRDRAPIVYFDHKFAVTAETLESAFTLADPGRAVLIRNTPRTKVSLDDEIGDALGQERYRIAMPRTVEWVSEAIMSRGLSRQTRIMNTGFMLYSDVARVRSLLDETYSTCWRLAQPECQIIWALLSQEYEDAIQRVDFYDLKCDWVDPGKDNPGPDSQQTAGSRASRRYTGKVRRLYKALNAALATRRPGRTIE